MQQHLHLPFGKAGRGDISPVNLPADELLEEHRIGCQAPGIRSKSLARQVRILITESKQCRGLKAYQWGF